MQPAGKLTNNHENSTLHAVIFHGHVSIKIHQAWKDACTWVFTAALFTAARTRGQPKCLSTDERIKMTWYVRAGILEYYSAIKKERTVCNNMDGLGGYCAG